MYFTTPFIVSILQYVKEKPQQPFYGSGFMFGMFTVSWSVKCHSEIIPVTHFPCEGPLVNEG